MPQIWRWIVRSKGRELDRIQILHTPAFINRKPKQIKGACAHVTAHRTGSQAAAEKSREAGKMECRVRDERFSRPVEPIGLNLRRLPPG